jgi:hypothetical protein
MSIGILFWVLMVIWLILGLVPVPEGAGRYWPWGGNLLLFILLFLLGWKAFGSPIQG